MFFGSLDDYKFNFHKLKLKNSLVLKCHGKPFPEIKVLTKDMANFICIAKCPLVMSFCSRDLLVTSLNTITIHC